MSEENKNTVKEAQKYFKQVEEGAKQYRNIPDKILTEKIRKVAEGAGEIVKHIEKRSDH
jgi:hypothetical protein